MNCGDGQLKVGLISPYAWTSEWGVNRHIRGLAAALADCGHDVCIIAPFEERDEVRSAKRKSRAAGQVLRDHQAGATPLTGAGNVNDAAATKTAAPVRLLKVTGTFRVPYSESLANLALPMEVTDQVEDILAREQFDILHLHEPYPPSLSFTALRLSQCPVVATFHTPGEHFLSYQLMRPVVERFFSRLDGRICTSQNTRRIVSGYFPGSYEVIGAGVNTQLFSLPELPEDEARPTKNPLVVYAAWSDPRKSLGLLLRVMRLLPTEVQQFQLAIVGGEELLWRPNFIVPRRLREQVTFVGKVDPRHVAATYRHAEILCAPYAAAGLTGAILEAMACGVAVIVPGRGGIKELVGEGSEGLLLDQPYSYNLAANLVDLLDNPRLRGLLGTNAARKARRYSWEKIVARVVKTYQRAHRRRRRPTRGALASSKNSKTILADLHIHTSYSKDCATTPAELLAACQECGLEAIAITDHNTIEGALEVAGIAPPHIHVIIGEEIKTVDGEIIGLYLTKEIPKGLTAEETIRRIKAQGGLVYIPHPFDPLHLTPTYDLMARNAADIDIIEIYNPRITFSAFNEKARRLAKKYDIPGGAGSDCHVVQGVGTAMLSLKKFNTPQELLASLRNADIIRSNKSPIYLHSLKLIKNGRSSVTNRP